jgi:hypothetical protein
MVELNVTNCCGLGELHGINSFGYGNSKDILYDVAVYWFDEEEFNGRFLVFTDVNKCSVGDRLTNYIRRNKLGKVQVSNKELNPNSTNMLKVYLWNVDIDAFKKWAKKNKVSVW